MNFEFKTLSTFNFPRHLIFIQETTFFVFYKAIFIFYYYICLYIKFSAKQTP